MTAIISILNNNLVNKLFSYLVKYLLLLRGVKIGKNFVARSLPILVKDKQSSIFIGDDVLFKDRVELRALKGSKLELERRLEQLRALENSMTIHVGYINSSPLSVDTKNDLMEVRKIMEKNEKN